MFHSVSPTEYIGRSVQAAVVLLTLQGAGMHSTDVMLAGMAGKGHRTVLGHANHRIARLSSKGCNFPQSEPYLYMSTICL